MHSPKWPLLLLVAFALGGALAVMAAGAAEERQQREAEVLADAAGVADAAAAEHSRVVEGGRQILAMLTRLPEVRAAAVAPAACSSTLATIVAAYPLYANAGVALPGGDIGCSALPTNGTVNAADRPWFRRALASGAFAVGDFQIGRITGRATVNFGQPVALDGGGTGVAFVAVDLAWLERHLAASSLPQGSMLLLVDRHGAVLGRWPTSQALLGLDASGTELVRAMRASGAGVGRLPGLDGEERLHAWRAMPGPEGDASAVVAAGVPLATAYAPVEEAFWRDAGRLALVAALAAVAVLAARRIEAAAAAFYEALARQARTLTGLQEAKRRLEDDAARRDAQLGAAVHELKNPLAPVRAHLGLLLDGDYGSLNADQRKALTTVRRNVERLGVLVQDLLDASRLQARALTVRREPCQLDRLVREAAEAFAEPARLSGVELQVAALPRVVAEADAGRMTQVLYNLLSNAVKFTPRGGRVTVRAEVREGKVVVSVRDTGVGMAPGEAATLFRPFRQLHPDGPRDGMGLGLYVSKGIVEAHGGRIWGASDGPGQGAEFGFAIPLPMEAPAPAEAAAPRAASG